MAKREEVDLSKLLSSEAVPMLDAGEPRAVVEREVTRPVRGVANRDEAATENLENLNFKVPKSFRKRFRDCAYRADLKQNELLFAALEAWEKLHGN